MAVSEAEQVMNEFMSKFNHPNLEDYGMSSEEIKKEIDGDINRFTYLLKDNFVKKIYQSNFEST